MRVLFLVILFVSFFLFYILCKKFASISKNGWIGFSFFLLGIPGCLISAYYLHLFDEMAWYYSFRSIPFIEFSLILLVPFFSYLSVCFPKTAPINFAAMIFLILSPFIKHIYSPLDARTVKNRVVDDVTMQTNPAICGPCSLATLLRKMKIEKNIAELVEACHTTNTGTEIWYINRYMKYLGLKTKFVLDSKALPVYPSIAGIRTVDFGHFITILDKKDGVYLIADPLYGKSEIPESVILKQIRFTGFYLQIIQ